MMGKQLASEGRQADLIIGNNVYAHVPDINDFTKGLKAALKINGTFIFRVPTLVNEFNRDKHNLTQSIMNIFLTCLLIQ